MGNIQNEPVAEIFGKGDMTDFAWPDSASGKFVHELFLPMLNNGISRYVRNINGELFILKIGDKLLPLTVLERSYTNAPVASPYAMYTSFTLHELRTIQNRILRAALLVSVGLLIRVIQPLLKLSKFNRVVLVNGLPFSTTLYPKLDAIEVLAVRKALTEKFPDHAIVFRTIDELTGGELMRHVRSAGCRLVYHRPAYHLHGQAPGSRRTPALRRDLALLRKTAYQIVPGSALDANDVDRICELYDSLFLGKYGPFNPEYTTQFFDLAVRTQSIEILALKKDGRVDGFIGLYDNGSALTDPFLGHDQALQKSLGLYRILSALVFLKAYEKAIPINFSAGVGLFKRRRGSQLAIEYLGVYVAHLGYIRRLPWRLLELCNLVAIPIMRRIEF